MNIFRGVTSLISTTGRCFPQNLFSSIIILSFKWMLLPAARMSQIVHKRLPNREHTLEVGKMEKPFKKLSISFDSVYHMIR